MAEDPEIVGKLAKVLNPSTLADLTAARMSHFSDLSAEPSEPTRLQLFRQAVTEGVPFIGFGIMDNMIMILAGDQIDASLGVAFGISTMCAAAIGNILSDLAGVGFGTVIEEYASKLGLPQAGLTAKQLSMRGPRYAKQFGMAVGITIGCVIGMFPLLFLDSKKIEKKKREVMLDSIFKDVVDEAKNLVGAQATTLFVVDDATKTLYAKYVGGSDSSHIKDIRVPIGAGIAGRVALTGESALIYDCRSEPDWTGRFDDDAGFVTKHMCCVPVTNTEGKVVAVVQAINKLEGGTARIQRQQSKIQRQQSILKNRVAHGKGGFNHNDLRVLQSLCSHIAVALERLDSAEDEGHGLRATMDMLKKSGSFKHADAPFGFRERRPLHKENPT
jgi:putative methionine-R-sulfoxide reductase with GAF domain